MLSRKVQNFNNMEVFETIISRFPYSFSKIQHQFHFLTTVITQENEEKCFFRKQFSPDDLLRNFEISRPRIHLECLCIAKNFYFQLIPTCQSWKNYGMSKINFSNFFSQYDSDFLYLLSRTTIFNSKFAKNFAKNVWTYIWEIGIKFTFEQNLDYFFG